MKTPEEILKQVFNSRYRSSYKEDIPKQCVFEAMQEYGKQQYNQAIKDAAENAEIEIERNGVKYQVKSALHGKSNYCVDKDSILKLLKP